MKLCDILVGKRDLILKSWRNRILETYPLDVSKFLKGEKDRFHNPVGEAIRQDTEIIFDHLVSEKGFDESDQFPRHLIKIRAVQDFSASDAVKFMIQLKSVIREQLKDEIARQPDEYIELETRIDDLILAAFDVYMGCRQAIHDIKVGEVKRMYSGGAVAREKPEKETE
jgi:hypothetical protein